jgi:molybdate transport system ATP-binding protein
MSSIEIRLRLRLGEFDLAADLDLPGRGITALFGASGSGKTTLLRWVAGLQSGSGTLRVNGECWQDEAAQVCLAPHQRPLGYVFQHTVLFPHLDVRANLEFGLQRVPAHQRRVAFDQAVALLGISHLLGRDGRGLSGGELQRIGIARALLCSPGLLLLDEPLAALDLARKREILPYLERLHAELDIPVLYVSHAPDEVARLADHLVVLEAGRVRAAGPLGEILARLDLPIRLGEDAGVVLQGQIVERDQRWGLARIATAAGPLWVRDGGMSEGEPARIRILARDVSIARAHHVSSISNTLPAVVAATVADDHPALVMVRLRVGAADIVARLTQRSAAQLQLIPGAEVWVQIKAVAVL